MIKTDLHYIEIKVVESFWMPQCLNMSDLPLCQMTIDKRLGGEGQGY